MNIAELFQAQAKRRPDAVAIVDTHGGRERHHSFAALASDAARTATLLSEQGIGKGDRVLVFQPMSYELYVVLLAIFRLGAVAMFLDPSAGRAHIEQCCDIGKPHALIASGKAHLLRFVSAALRGIRIKFVVGRYAPGAVSLRRSASCAPQERIEPCSAQTPALLTFTSGSTGRPKAALRSQGFLMAQHRVLERALDLRAGQVDLTTLPIFLLANLASGLSSVIPDADLRYPGRIDAAPVVRQIERLAVTRSAGSPAFYRCLLAYCELKGRNLNGLCRVDTGGAPVFPGLLARLQRVAPNARLVAVYGSTEAEPMAEIVWAELDGATLDAMRSGQGLIAGFPVSDVDLRILPDRFGDVIGPYTPETFAAESLAAGDIGEVVVSGDHVLKGYLDGQGDEETKFDVGDERWHRTGDAGYIDVEGRLWLVGRCSARIEDAKGLLYPFTVECAARFHASVRHCAMVAHRERRILLIESDGSLDRDALAADLHWAGIDEIRLLKRIPVDKRHNAKVDYPRLRKLLT